MTRFVEKPLPRLCKHIPVPSATARGTQPCEEAITSGRANRAYRSAEANSILILSLTLSATHRYSKGLMEDILRILERDARATAERIATMTGRSVDEVRRLIKEAEADRRILSYKTQVDWDKTGAGPVAALIEVRMTPQRNVGFNALATRIARFPEVRAMHLVSGDYDLLIQVAGKSIYDIANFVSSKLSVMEAVQGTNTHFILKRYKEDGTLIAGDDGEDERLPLSM